MTLVNPVNPTEKYTDIDKNDFIAIIGTYVPLTENKEFPRGYCPLCHNDAHRYRGFLLLPDELKWCCEGCGEEGDIYNFFEKLRRISYEESVRFANILIKNHAGHQNKSVNPATLVKFPKPRQPAPKPEASVVATNAKSETSTDTVIPIQPSKPPKPVSTPDIADQDAPVTAGTKSEITEEAVDIAPDTPTKDTKEGFLSELLNKFDGRKGYLGIAIINQDDNSLLGSTMEDLVPKDIETMNGFMESTLPATQKEIGEYEIEAGNTVVSMENKLKSEDLKLLWMPMNKGLCPCNVLLLLEKNTPDSLYLMQLKNYFKE